MWRGARSLPNFRGHVYQHFDGAGVATSATYDFEGRVTHATRQLASNYQSTPAWGALAALTDPTTFLPAAVAAGAPGLRRTSSTR